MKSARLRERAADGQDAAPYRVRVLAIAQTARRMSLHARAPQPVPGGGA